MGNRILIINGHPDATQRHFCAELADAYDAGAASMRREVRRIDVATLDFPQLTGKDDFESGMPPASIRAAQEVIRWADHLVIIHPLWLGMMPARLKAFFEQVFRPDFAYRIEDGKTPRRLLKGRSARIVITMGMPAFAYRWLFGAHGLKALRRSVLWFCGIGPIADTLIGRIEQQDPGVRTRALKTMFDLGRAGR